MNLNLGRFILFCDTEWSLSWSCFLPGFGEWRVNDDSSLTARSLKSWCFWGVCHGLLWMNDLSGNSKSFLPDFFQNPECRHSFKVALFEKHSYMQQGRSFKSKWSRYKCNSPMMEAAWKWSLTVNLLNRCSTLLNAFFFLKKITTLI